MFLSIREMGEKEKKWDMCVGWTGWKEGITWTQSVIIRNRYSVMKNDLDCHLPEIWVINIRIRVYLELNPGIA